MSVERNQGVGPLIASMIIVLLLLVGGYYSFKTTSLPPPITNNVDTQPSPAISIPATPPQESTEISDIEEDAKAVDLSDIDTGLENLDLLVSE